MGRNRNRDQQQAQKVEPPKPKTPLDFFKEDQPGVETTAEQQADKKPRKLIQLRRKDTGLKKLIVRAVSTGESRFKVFINYTDDKGPMDLETICIVSPKEYRDNITTDAKGKAEYIFSLDDSENCRSFTVFAPDSGVQQVKTVYREEKK